jgi:hypothetical protein
LDFTAEGNMSNLDDARRSEERGEDVTRSPAQCKRPRVTVCMSPVANHPSAAEAKVAIADGDPGELKSLLYFVRPRGYYEIL